MKEKYPSAYVNVRIVKDTKRRALTYIFCVFHRNAASAGAWGSSRRAGVVSRGRKRGSSPALAASGPSPPGVPPGPAVLRTSCTGCERDGRPRQSRPAPLLGVKAVALRSNPPLAFVSYPTAKTGGRKQTQLHFRLEARPAVQALPSRVCLRARHVLR